MSKKIRNLSLCSKIIRHSLLVQNFTPVGAMLLKIQYDPSPVGYGRFFKCHKIHNLNLFIKIIEHCHFVHNFTPVVVEMSSKIQSSPSPEGYGHFSNVKRGIVLRKKIIKKIPLLFKKILRLVNGR